MSQRKDNQDPSRRKLLKSIIAGGGAAMTAGFVPETWTRPVVESVLLPAHAQTSGPPISTEPNRRCGIVACLIGGDAIDTIPVTNLSGTSITLTNVTLSNPNHSFEEPPLPLVIPGGACRTLVIVDSTRVCGTDPIGDGVATLVFDGFAPIDVDLPTVSPGP